MHQKNKQVWQHTHAFGQDKKQKGEAKTLLVVAITVAMMLIEIAAGIIYGSMALLADGLHMASHAIALSINVFAYIYARRHAHDSRFSFGTGKVNALGGFTGAVLLGMVALIMAAESTKRILSPVQISFNQAIFVAMIGLLVNGISVWILDVKHHEHDHDHGHDHHHHHDHNLRSAYLHVLADALTSVLAIAALLMAKYFGLNWMDPIMGIVGAVLVFRWSWGLIHTTGHVLLDKQGPEELQKKIKGQIENDGDSQVVDLHLWSVGPNIYSAIISIVAHNPLQPEEYKKIIADKRLAHVTVEVCKCSHEAVAC